MEGGEGGGAEGGGGGGRGGGGGGGRGREGGGGRGEEKQELPNTYTQNWKVRPPNCWLRPYMVTQAHRPLMAHGSHGRRENPAFTHTGNTWSASTRFHLSIITIFHLLESSAFFSILYSPAPITPSLFHSCGTFHDSNRETVLDRKSTRLNSSHL